MEPRFRPIHSGAISVPPIQGTAVILQGRKWFINSQTSFIWSCIYEINYDYKKNIKPLFMPTYTCNHNSYSKHTNHESRLINKFDIIQYMWARRFPKRRRRRYFAGESHRESCQWAHLRRQWVHWWEACSTYGLSEGIVSGNAPSISLLNRTSLCILPSPSLSPWPATPSALRRCVGKKAPDKDGENEKTCVIIYRDLNWQTEQRGQFVRLH